MIIKVEDLTGRALDWAVSVAHEDAGLKPVPYSTAWEFGGVIIEWEKLKLHCGENNIWWAATNQNPHRPVSGPTPLIAAMRCCVASVLGDEVDVPDEWL